MASDRALRVMAALAKATLGIGLLLLFTWEGIYYRFAPVPSDLRFRGSSSCSGCHEQEHAAWQESLHRKMMRRASEPDAVVASFVAENRPPLFEPDDVVWTIGSKWQQQFMGHDGKTETLLPGAWQIGNAQWKHQAWDGWSEPAPLQRCHGCHSVGLDLATGRFVEAGIGCESCHGAGEWHIKSRGLAPIHTGLEAQQCGQCHSRGRSVDGSAFFPKEFKPGAELSDYFAEWEPDYLQNSSAWWGNGTERDRHQEYTAWKTGGHADSLNSLLVDYAGQYGAVTDECLSCHSAEGALNPNAEPISLADARNGITCSVCHNVHGSLDEIRVPCMQCHGDGAYYHRTERLADHIPCPPEAQVQCEDCHMPKTVRLAGEFQLHSHRPGIVTAEDTAKFGVPNSCSNGGCHIDDERPFARMATAPRRQFSRPIESAAARAGGAQ